MNSLRSFIITFLIALLIFGLCAFFITGFVTNSITDLLSGENMTETTSDSTDTSDVDSPNRPDEPEDESESFNVLLIGTDYRPSILNNYHPEIETQYPYFEDSAKLIGYNGSLPVYPYRTVSADAVVLVCVNKEKKRFTYMQIPTDMQLTVGGVTTTVSELYYDKGLAYFVNKMSGITGVAIDYYALTSIEQIADVADAMGEILYTVPCDMDYTDEVSGLTISLKSGTQNLKGKDVAGLLAYNSYTNPALSREKTCLSFLMALAQRMTNVTYLNKAVDIFANIEEYLCTNITSKDLLKNLDLIFSYSDFEINQIEYPGSYYYRDGVRYFTPNISAAITEMAKNK